jgi:hypothetical protein
MNILIAKNMLFLSRCFCNTIIVADNIVNSATLEVVVVVKVVIVVLRNQAMIIRGYPSHVDLIRKPPDSQQSPNIN